MGAIGTSKAVNVHGVNPILSLKVQFKVFLVMQCNHKKNERQPAWIVEIKPLDMHSLKNITGIKSVLRLVFAFLELAPRTYIALTVPSTPSPTRCWLGL